MFLCISKKLLKQQQISNLEIVNLNISNQNEKYEELKQQLKSQVTYLSGTSNYSFVSPTEYRIINFQTPFASIPKVTAVITKATKWSNDDLTSSAKITVSEVAQTFFKITCTIPSGHGDWTANISWVAESSILT